MSAPAGNDEEKEFGVIDNTRYQFSSNLVTRLYQAVKKDKEAKIPDKGLTLDEKVAMLTELENPDGKHDAAMVQQVTKSFTEGDTALYQASYKVMDGKGFEFLKEGKKIIKTEDRWKIVDAFIEQAVRHMYNVKSDAEWKSFKESIKKQMLSRDDKDQDEKKVDEAILKQLRKLYDDALGKGQLRGEGVENVYSENLASALYRKNDDEARTYLNQMSQLAAKVHTQWMKGRAVEHLVDQSVLYKFKQMTQKHMEDNKYEHEEGLDKIPIDNMLKLAAKDKYKDKVTIDYEKMGFYKPEPKEDAHASH